MDSVGVGAETQSVNSGHMSFRILTGDVKLEVEGVLLELVRELWAGDINVGVICKQVMAVVVCVSAPQSGVPKFQQHGRTQMVIIPREVGQKEKDRPCMISLICRI